MSHNWTIELLIGSAIFGLLSGYGGLGLGGAALTGALVGSGEGPPPRVLCSTEDSIGVIYQELNTRQDEAMQLISEHCAGEYVEVKRVNDFFYWGSVYAICLNVDGSPAVSQPCEYDPDEHVGFGQEDIATPDG